MFKRARTAGLIGIAIIVIDAIAILINGGLALRPHAGVVDIVLISGIATGLGCLIVGIPLMDDAFEKSVKDAREIYTTVQEEHFWVGFFTGVQTILKLRS